METFAYRLGKEFCTRIPFSFPPCGTSDARLILGYFFIAAGIAGLIVAVFYVRDRPVSGR